MVFMLTPEEKRQNLKEYHQTKEYKRLRNKELFEKRLKQKGDIEKVDIYPAGRGKKLVIKTVITPSKKTKRQKNPNRLCLCSIPSNPENIKFTMLRKSINGELSFWVYPEGRRLSYEEFDNLLASLLAYRKFRKLEKQGGEPSVLMGKMHLGLRLLRIEEKEFLKKYGLQCKRIADHYYKKNREWLF
jgi:hypothetical protein